LFFIVRGGVSGGGAALSKRADREDFVILAAREQGRPVGESRDWAVPRENSRPCSFRRRGHNPARYWGLERKRERCIWSASGRLRGALSI